MSWQQLGTGKVTDGHALFFWKKDAFFSRKVSLATPGLLTDSSSAVVCLESKRNNGDSVSPPESSYPDISFEETC